MKPQLESFGFVWVRDRGTYIARFAGKTASCSSGPELAAEAAARKVMKDREFTLKKISDYCWEVWA